MAYERSQETEMILRVEFPIQSIRAVWKSSLGSTTFIYLVNTQTRTNSRP